MIDRRIHVKLSVVAFLSIISSFSIAQNKFTDNLNLGVNYHYGFAIPEYQIISKLVDSPINSLSVNLTKKTTGKNEWERLYKYPENGVSFYYTNLGNDSLLGKAFALNYFFKINFINREKFNFFNQTGIGIGYVTKKFDLTDNYLNVAVGSHLNVHFNARFGFTRIITTKMSFNAGLSFDHFSNANTNDPNLGINYFTAFGGLSYAITKVQDKNIEKISEHIHKNNYEIFANIGGKHARSLSSQYFVTHSLTGGVNREIGRVVHLGVGGDVFYDSSVEWQLQNRGQATKTSDNIQTGIHISQEFRYNRFSLILQEGIYLGFTNKVNNKLMYNRGIMQYKITEHFCVRIAMKSHLHILDYPELGIGIKL